MVKTLCIVQARLTSSRLPDKVLRKLGKDGKTIAEHIYERLSQCRHIDKIVFAIPLGERNDMLEAFLMDKGIPCFRGSEDNVLERFYYCAKTYEPEIVIRATSDNPFVDWLQVDLQIESLAGFDYVSSKDAPLGTGVEVFYANGLYEAYAQVTSDREREHVTPFLYLHPELFQVNRVLYRIPHVEHYRLTVDTDEDFELAHRIYDELYNGKPIDNVDVYQYLSSHPEVSLLNQNVVQKEGDLISKR